MVQCVTQFWKAPPYAGGGEVGRLTIIQSRECISDINVKASRKFSHSFCGKSAKPVAQDKVNRETVYALFAIARGVDNNSVIIIHYSRAIVFAPLLPYFIFNDKCQAGTSRRQHPTQPQVPKGTNLPEFLHGIPHANPTRAPLFPFEFTKGILLWSVLRFCGIPSFLWPTEFPKITDYLFITNGKRCHCNGGTWRKLFSLGNQFVFVNDRIDTLTFRATNVMHRGDTIHLLWSFCQKWLIWI